MQDEKDFRNSLHYGASYIAVARELALRDHYADAEEVDRIVAEEQQKMNKQYGAMSDKVLAIRAIKAYTNVGGNIKDLI